MDMNTMMMMNMTMLNLLFYLFMYLTIHLSISGRDPRPRGVATVGAVLEEEEEDVINEYEYYDQDDYLFIDQTIDILTYQSNNVYIYLR